MNAPSERRKPRVPRAMDIAFALTTQPPMPDFVLPGLPTGCVGALVAPGATGKTTFLLQLCVALALGVPAFDGALFESDVPPEPCTVVLVVAEENVQLMHIRLHAVAAELLSRLPGGAAVGEEFVSRLASNLRILPLAGGPAMRLDEDDSTSFGVESLEAVAQGARLVVLDPLRQFHRGEENDSGAMTHLVQVLQGLACRLDCAVLLAHHTNKWSTAGGQGDRAAAARGSGAFTDAVRWQLNLSEPDDATAAAHRIHPDEVRQYVRVDLAKANYLPAQPALLFKRGNAGVLVPHVGARSGAPRRAAAKGVRSQRGRA